MSLLEWVCVGALGFVLATVALALLILKGAQALAARWGGRE